MVFHDQSHDISSQIQNFDDHMRLIELDVHAVHTGPLIRCEVPYRNWSLEDRKKLFSSFFNFMRKTSIKYDVILLNKRDLDDRNITVAEELAHKLSQWMNIHRNLFNGFNKVICYYDNGQQNIRSAIRAALQMLPDIESEIKITQPVNYRLEQVADLVCTMELLSLKSEKNILSKTEIIFFGTRQLLRKNYLKQFARQKL